MGSSPSQPLSSQLQNYKIIQKVPQQSLTHLTHLQTDKQYLLRQLTYNQQSSYKKSLGEHQARLQLNDQHLTHLIKYEHKEYDQLCSNIYKIYGIWEFPYRNLKDQIHQRSYQNRKFQEKEIWSILASCIFALNTLQKNKIRYQILSTKNILLDYSGVVKLADPLSTGSPTNLQSLTRSRTSSPQLYLSPQQCYSLENHSSYNNPYKSDVYILAMIILECGLLQQMNSCYKDQYQRIDYQNVNNKLNVFGNQYGNQLKVFLDSMLRRDSQDRPDWIDLAQFARKFQNNTNPSYNNSPDKDKVSDISNVKLNLTPNSDKNNDQSLSMYPSSNKNNSKFSNLSQGTQGQLGLTQQGQIGLGGQQAKFVLDSYQTQQPPVSVSGVSFGNNNNSFVNTSVLPSGVPSMPKPYFPQNPTLTSYPQYPSPPTTLLPQYQAPQLFSGNLAYVPPGPSPLPQRPLSSLSLQKPPLYIPAPSPSPAYSVPTSVYTPPMQHLHRPTQYSIGSSSIGTVANFGVSTQGNLFPNPITTTTTSTTKNEIVSPSFTTPATTTTNSVYISNPTNQVSQIGKTQAWRNFMPTSNIPTVTNTTVTKTSFQFDKFKQVSTTSNSGYQIPTSAPFMKTATFDVSKENQSLFTPPSLLQSLTQPKMPLPYPYNTNTGMDFKYGNTFTSTSANSYGVLEKPIAPSPQPQILTNPVVNSYNNYNPINQGIGVSLKQYKPSSQGYHKQSSPSSSQPAAQQQVVTNPSILPTQSLQQQINTVQSNHQYAASPYLENSSPVQQRGASGSGGNIGGSNGGNNGGSNGGSNGGEPEFVIETFKQGSRYEGYKLKDMRHGHGKFYYQDGGMYDGNWHNNKMDGFGSLYYQSGELAYQGMWKEDQFQGKGKLYNQYPYQLDDEFNYENFDTIDQYWSYYQGDFVEDFKKGKGMLMLSNGEFFQGTFNNDMVEGPGAFHCRDGKVIKGVWKQNHLVSH